MSGANMSVADMIGRCNQNPDSSLYFDGVTSGDAFPATVRVFVPRYRLVFVDHFLGDSIDTRWNSTTQGTPTAATIRDEKNGVLALALASTSEAETNEQNWNDLLQLDTTSGLVMEVAFKFSGAIAANERAVIGFGSARNNTYDSVARNAWFRVDAAMDLLTESDDGTTDTDDKDSTQNLTANNYHYGRIEMLGPNDVRFYAGSSVPTRINSGTTFKIGSTLVQPIISIQKASGASTPRLDVDYINIHARR